MTTSSAPETVAVQVHIPADLHRRLKIHAINQGISMRDDVLAAIAAWVDG